ncbi:MAG TPA: peptide ABC transporter substrate-binding protein [Gemmatimonadales bacterium]|nr:peptide ABC transporter substrate-binding protein [Gemmatimonadales bacterium]
MRFTPLLVLLALVACGGRERCDACETISIAAVGEPGSVLPPLVQETVGRDIGDQIYERLAALTPPGSPLDPAAYRPALATRWERVDSLAWRFHLRPGARWHDGRPVTSDDVRFSFDAFADSVFGAPARPYLAGRVSVEPEDSATFLIRFTEPSPEQLYDATYHVRIIPKHVWEGEPRESWAADTAVARLVGSGPYRPARWVRGQFAELVADSASRPTARIRRVIWRFTADPDAALNLVLSHEADVLETAIGPERVRRAQADSALRVTSYPSAAFGFLGFNLRAAGGGPHRVLGETNTRRGLALATDRTLLARSVFGADAKAPPGPMSQLLWLWSDSIPTLPFDRLEADRTLSAAGWRMDPRDSVRRRQGKPLALDILVPSTSGARRRLAEELQQMWRQVGARVTVTAVDFPVFQERLAAGRFDAYIGAWLDEPSARGIADQWSRTGWEGSNYGRYASTEFDSLLGAAMREPRVDQATRLYRAALARLNSDAPAIFLYSPANAAVVNRRVADFALDPYSWAAELRQWRLTGP